jgi:c-di-GMP-binding flagellar brake protein YcgR
MTTTAASDRLEDFRVDSPVEIDAWLRQLLDQQPRLQLSTPEGATLSTRLWSMDSEHHSLGFEVRPGDPQLQALLDSREIAVVAYLDNVRLEFELDALVLIQGDELSTLRAPWPQQLYRFQRRQAFRVQPLSSGYPRVQLPHPTRLELKLQLRVLDLSVSGLALLLPVDVPPLEPGQLLVAARVELDSDTHFEAALRLQHISSCSAPQLGERLGCAFARLPHGADRALQRYIDQTQKRQRLLKKS